MKKILFAIIAAAALTGCHKDDSEPTGKAGRTVLIYMAAENNLGYEQELGSGIDRYANDDILEIKEGMKTIGNNHLVVYVDKPRDPEEAYRDPVPYMLHFWNGELRDSIPMEESLTSDPAVFEKVLRKAYGDYPAESYGLVLWGHSTGWIISNDSVTYTAMGRKKAYGGDTGNDTYHSAGKTWMNIPSMAKVLSRQPQHLTFIFADCCNFMCLESLYELRRTTDYYIGSPAEIPAVGGPYATLVPSFFEPATLIGGVPQFAKSIVDKYYAQRAGGYDLPLSVVKASEMDQMASATRTALLTFGDKIKNGVDGNDREGYPDMRELIYYYYNPFYKQQFYDANDFMLRYAETADYKAWKAALDRAVVYKKMATRWMTDKRWISYYNDFEMTEEKFGGVSMFVPVFIAMYTENKTIQQMSWYYAAGYNEIGW